MRIDKNRFSIVSNLFGSVRKIIAISLTLVFCYLGVSGKISGEQFTPIFTMVIGYYFGKSTALDVPGKNDENINN
ncbi:MAG: hypothetical protein ACRDA3_12770 [Peptostreptococcaceae bacterium]